VFTVDATARDANAAYLGTEKSFLANTDAAAPNLNFPAGLTPPYWFMVYITDDGRAVTQTCWNDTSSLVYTRTGEINDSDSENLVATWGPWNAAATPTVIKSVTVEENPDGRPSGTYLVIVSDTESGDVTSYVNLSQILGAGYASGNGAIDISADNKISLRLDPDASHGLVVAPAGLQFTAYELCEFYYFRHPTLRAGFQPAQGGVIANAAMLYPDAWAYLQTSEGQLLCKTEAEWQALTTAVWHTNADGSTVGWNGIGGAPFYAPDYAAGALRLPDLRGMYMEAAGFDSLDVGGVHGDAIRNIAGTAAQSSGAYAYGLLYSNNPAVTGVMYAGPAAGGRPFGDNLQTGVALGFKASRVVPTGNANKPRAWGALACVYLGQPAL
jgi:hypothetical protein